MTEGRGSGVLAAGVTCAGGACGWTEAPVSGGQFGATHSAPGAVMGTTRHQGRGLSDSTRLPSSPLPFCHHGCFSEIATLVILHLISAASLQT